MTTAALPRFVRRSPIALLAAVLLSLLVTVIEVPHAAAPALANVPALSA